MNKTNAIWELQTCSVLQVRVNFNWPEMDLTELIMRKTQGTLSCQIDLHPGEKLVLPDEIQQQVGPGLWLVTICPVDGPETVSIRDHQAFLNGYAPEDEGLYDGTVPR